MKQKYLYRGSLKKSKANKELAKERELRLAKLTQP